MADESRSGDARNDTNDESGSQSGGGGGSKSRKGRMGDGIRQGIGILSAFKEALEETIQEARDRGDLSAERAKEVMKDALDRAQSAAEDAKERLDFAHQSELEAVQASLAALEDRVRAVEQAVFGPAEEKGEEEAKEE